VVEGAEGAVDVADIRVVDVAVDDVADAARIVVAVPGGRGRHGQIRELRAFKQHERLGGGNPPALDHAIQDVLGRREGLEHV